MRGLLLTFATVCLFAQTEALLERADQAFREGNLGRAETLARQAVAADPNALHGHMILGVIAAQRNQWDVSNKHFLAVIRLDPSNPFGYFYLGQAKLYQQQWAAAVRYFNQALERQYPDRDRLMIELSMAQNEAGHPDQALASLGGIAPPSDPRLGAQYYAVTAFARGKLDQTGPALEAIRQSLQIDDSNPHAWEFLIGALIQADEAPTALAEAIRAQKKFPDQPEVQYLFVLANYHVNESPLSGLALRNLREADPSSPRVLLAEGLLRRKQGKVDEATAAFRQAAERGVPDARLLLGIVYRENGDYPAAEREYRAAEKQNPRNGQVALELGKLLLARGDAAEARTRLERAAVLMPTAGTVQYQLGLLYRRLGEPEKAEQHFQKSKELGSQSR
jgi:tetratricopeptide (TPR) repeat protein